MKDLLIVVGVGLALIAVNTFGILAILPVAGLYYIAKAVLA